MDAHVYNFSLGVLTVANGLLGYLSSRAARPNTEEASKYRPLIERPVQDSKDAIAFQREFFAVYTVVVAADWLQGPYMYALYKDEKNLPEATVAMLFAAGFVAAAASASFVGDLADRYGRKLACQCFCVINSASCATMICNQTWVLFLGRLLGGVSTTLMFSIFETWMVAEYHARSMREKGLPLSLILGRMTTLSSIIAIIAGVISQLLVDISKTKVTPFLAAIACLGAAAVMITSLWPENYGAEAKPRGEDAGVGSDIRTILKDRKIVSLGLICCLFEGTMYLFVFFWSAALKSAREASHNTASPTFGLVFATFMSAMMLGSLIFSLTSRSLTLSSAVHTLSLAIVLSAASLLAIVLFKSEALTLWAFCLFETCVGIYYPSMGYLKGQLVSDGIRGKVYGALRLPLNLFVVVTLGLTQEGDAHRDKILATCSGLLILAYVICQKYLSQL